MPQSFTIMLRERWRTHPWSYSPPPPFRNIQYIATALLLLHAKKQINGTAPQPAIELIKTGLPSASAEETTFTFELLQEPGMFSPEVTEAFRQRKGMIEFQGDSLT
jgi:hypothetical protein